MAVLVIFAGLPGVGKTTLAKRVASQLRAAYFRADTAEQAMRNWGLADDQIGGMGYGVGYALATENLSLGISFVADTVNPWELTREAWRAAAIKAGCRYLDVEVICSEANEHRHRVETRIPDIEGHNLPDWQAVIERDYHPFTSPRLMVDTSQETCDRIVDWIVAAVRALEG